MEKEIKQIVQKALKEDIGKKDITTTIALPSFSKGEAVILAKDSGILCGINIAAEIFKSRDKQSLFKPLKKEGGRFKPGDKIAYIRGDARKILTLERVALNFLSLLSGISTLTAKFVEKVEGTGVKILDTRKTTPTLRWLEKYAVKIGGGYNHRQNLTQGIIIKDNHFKAGKFIHQGKIDENKFAALIAKFKKDVPLKIEVEVETLEELKGVIKYNPAVVMLDNFPLAQLKKAVILKNKCFPKVLIEASGGVSLKNVKKIAMAGVDFISIGSITHSSAAIDFSLEII